MAFLNLSFWLIDLISDGILFHICGPLTMKLLLPARDLRRGIFRSRVLSVWLRRLWLLLWAEVIQFLTLRGASP